MCTTGLKNLFFEVASVFLQRWFNLRKFPISSKNVLSQYPEIYPPHHMERCKVILLRGDATENSKRMKFQELIRFCRRNKNENRQPKATSTFYPFLWHHPLITQLSKIHIFGDIGANVKNF